MQLLKRAGRLDTNGLGVLLVFVVAIAAYAYTLSLPLFWDDVLHYEWLDRVSMGEVWQRPLEGLNYFRPVPFAIWKTFYALLGYHPVVLYHAINVLLHAVNACLVAQLARHFVAKRGAAIPIAAGLFFALFRFSFQAVAPVNSLTHPAHVALVLLAVLLASRGSALRWQCVSAVCAFLAVLAHENGVLTAALVTLALAFRGGEMSVGVRVIAGMRAWPQWLAVALGFLYLAQRPAFG